MSAQIILTGRIIRRGKTLLTLQDTSSANEYTISDVGAAGLKKDKIVRVKGWISRTGKRPHISPVTEIEIL